MGREGTRVRLPIATGFRRGGPPKTHELGFFEERSRKKSGEAVDRRNVVSKVRLPGTDGATKVDSPFWVKRRTKG